LLDLPIRMCKLIHEKGKLFLRRTIAKFSLAILANFVLSHVALAEVGKFVSSELVEKLNQPISATWEGQQLGSVLERISATQGIVIWLDRRVDPQQEVSLRLRSFPLLAALQDLARNHDLGVAGLEDIVYLGPISSSIELTTLHGQLLNSLSQTSDQTQRRWLTPAPLEWAHLSEPKELLRNWLSQSGIAVENEALIPHDLLPAREFPDTSLASRVTLLLAGFDLTCEISSDGRTCTVVTISRPLVVEQCYRISGESFADLVQEFPDARITEHSDGFTLTGTWQDHAVVRMIVERDQQEARAERVPPDSTQRFSLKLENQRVGRVVAHLAEQLDLTVEWSADLLRSRGDVGDELTSCEVIEVELEELLQCILKPVGLEFRLEGKRLMISDSTN